MATVSVAAFADGGGSGSNLDVPSFTPVANHLYLFIAFWCTNTTTMPTGFGTLSNLSGSANFGTFNQLVQNRSQTTGSRRTGLDVFWFTANPSVTGSNTIRYAPGFNNHYGLQGVIVDISFDGTPSAGTFLQTKIANGSGLKTAPASFSLDDDALADNLVLDLVCVHDLQSGDDRMTASTDWTELFEVTTWPNPRAFIQWRDDFTGTTIPVPEVTGSDTQGEWSAIAIEVDNGGTAGGGSVVPDAAAEDDTALDVTPAKALTADTASSADTAAPPTAAKATTAPAGVEVDTATGPTATKAMGVADAGEVDTAQPATAAKTATADPATTADVAGAPTVAKVLTLDVAVVDDTALDVAVDGATSTTLGPGVEGDTANAPAASKVLVLDVAAETTTALDPTPTKTTTPAAAVEVDMAQLLGDRTKLAALVAAAEVDHAPDATIGPADTRTNPTGTSALATAPGGTSTATAPAGISTMTATPEGSSTWLS